MHSWAVFVALAAATGSLVFYRGSRIEHALEGGAAIVFGLLAAGIGLGLVH